MNALPKIAWYTIITLPLSFAGTAALLDMPASDLPPLGFAFLVVGLMTSLLLMAYWRTK